jgi:hypothetical protein
MGYRLLLLPLLLALTQMGCVSAIPSGTLEWEPPVLSPHGCPDLTGTYQDKGTLSQVFYAGLGMDKLSGEEPIARRTIVKTPFTHGSPAGEMTAAERAFNRRAILTIRQQNDVLDATLMDSTGEVYERIVVRLDTPLTGCHRGALILRWKSIGRRAEWGGGDVVWGEREIRKLEDGSLIVTSRRRQRSLSMVTGGPAGNIRIWPETTNQYEVVRMQPGTSSTEPRVKP